LRDVPSLLSQPIEAPRALHAQLRGYQLQGLRWLRFLRESGLAGILADDMGLGKTIQVIAHVLLERERGQNLPVLVVAPTSVLPNWQAEVKRFAPSLSMLNLSGAKRKSQYDKIQSSDLVFSSYALVGRDISELGKHRFALVVLDEAQMVKNPNTLAAKAARKIQAEHRLCMTGTPLENHLGDLWAQFDFLMPGFLGGRSTFQRRFRAPIEKKRDPEAARTLKNRIAPFLLRRTKDQVIDELPPKSIIVKRIDMEGRQRDLYETLRLSLRMQMQQQAGNRIQLLDALLKLRQVCCDPRLVKLEAAKQAGSAKLEQLADMLSALVAEGRRVLVFSQFTSMLSLIEDELRRRKLRYTLLTGQQDDRETPVQRFQRKEVPIFLISLRAGGFGLNLTAADTVIHYDPWWNPAVEEQATDRAYRIGQTNPVFVYRLIAAGSIEERIEQMKDKKRELLGSVLDGQDASLLNDAELLALLDDA
jgi:SNF2 family DNA or RNA helicase